MPAMSLLARLGARGLLQGTTFASEALASAFLAQLPPASSVYLGVDATGSGLHLGHLSVLKALSEAANSGLRPIVLLGGFTAQIGDPSGKSNERSVLSAAVVDSNVRSLESDLSGLFDRMRLPGVEVVNNASWLSSMPLLSFMSTVGRHFRVPEMIGRSKISERLQSSEGISYLEFSYQLFQSYDFYRLYESHGCRLQLGGSDQWGNIVSGIDYIRKRSPAAEVGGLTIPLLTTRSGEKLGKTAGNAVWLSESKTSNVCARLSPAPQYDFYQYLYNQSDEDALALLRSLSDLSAPELQDIESEFRSHPEARAPQMALAGDLFRQTRGEEQFRKAQLVSRLLLGARVSQGDLQGLVSEVPHVRIPSSGVSGFPLSRLFLDLGLTSTRKEAKRLVSGRGGYVDNEAIENSEATLPAEPGRLFVLRHGRNRCGIVSVE